MNTMRDRWDSSNFWIGVVFSSIICALVAVYILLINQLTNWFVGLTFSPWSILVIVIAVCSICSILSGFSEWIAICLLIAAIVVGIPVIIVFAPIWIPGWFIYKRYQESRQHKYVRDKLKQYVDLVKKKTLGQMPLEELPSNLDLLPVPMLVEAFKVLIDNAPDNWQNQINRAWGGYSESGQEKIVEALSNAIKSMLEKQTIFETLDSLENLNDVLKVDIFGRVSLSIAQKSLADICSAYAILHIAEAVSTPTDYSNLLGRLYEVGITDWTWASGYMESILQPEIWAGFLSYFEQRKGHPYAYIPMPEVIEDKEIPSESVRLNRIFSYSISAFSATTEVPHGRERLFCYRLLQDFEQARFEQDMIALSNRTDDNFSTSEPGLLYPNLVLSLQDLRIVCNLINRSELYGMEVTDRLAFHAAALGIVQEISRSRVEGLRPPDSWFVIRIVNRWFEIIINEISKMKARAELSAETASVQTNGLEYIVGLQLHNRASGVAEQVKVQFDPEKSLERNIVSAVQDTVMIDFIRGNQSVTISLRFIVNRPGRFRIPFRIEYDDLERENKSFDFADEISFAVEQRGFIAPTRNPYISGPPLKKRSNVFYGRESILQFVEQNLPAGEQHNIIVLYGERRTGKTSILYRLMERLQEPLVPILIDMQAIPWRAPEDFWYYIATCIHSELEARGREFEAPSYERFTAEGGFNHFRQHFLKQVQSAIPGLHPVLLIDEFDILDQQVRAGVLPSDTPSNLRHLMQHSELWFVFAGTYDITKLGEEYLSVLFNTALWRRIELLDKVSFESLVKEPVQSYFAFDEYALTKIWEMTAGHPFFVQLLCHELVNYANERQITYFTIQAVNDVIRSVIGAGQIHLGYMWDGLAQEKKQFLVLVSQLLETKGTAVIPDIKSALHQYQVSINLEDALKELTAKAIIEEKQGIVSFPIGLVRQWIYQTKSLERLA
jgi:hypothetical protein